MRGDLEKLPTNFSKAALEAHFSSEYVKVVGCSPDLVLIQNLAIYFRKLWQMLKKKKMVLTTPRGRAFLSVKLPVPVVKKDKEKVSEKKTEKEREKETETEKEQEDKRPQQCPRKSFEELYASTV